MAIKTFTSGAVLTSADTNTYLNNGGLVYITYLKWHLERLCSTDSFS
jgi:hypothetical protein